MRKQINVVAYIDAGNSETCRCWLVEDWRALIGWWVERDD